MNYCMVDSPIGLLLLAGDEAGLRVLAFAEGTRPSRPSKTWQRDDGSLREVARELQAYFAGTLRRFSVPVAPEGTAFQQTVWNALQEIPYGETMSYGEVARRIGNPNAVRAVGLANGSNPIAIIIPCHRVIGSNGSLTGYGGGLPVKRALLALEKGQHGLL